VRLPQADIGHFRIYLLVIAALALACFHLSATSLRSLERTMFKRKTAAAKRKERSEGEEVEGGRLRLGMMACTSQILSHPNFALFVATAFLQVPPPPQTSPPRFPLHLDPAVGSLAGAARFCSLTAGRCVRVSRQCAGA
jgi:hypothetical protein